MISLYQEALKVQNFLYETKNDLKSIFPYYFLSKKLKSPGSTPFKCGLSAKALKNSINNHISQ